jgi:hypothetical protein
MPSPSLARSASSPAVRALFVRAGVRSPVLSWLVHRAGPAAPGAGVRGLRPGRWKCWWDCRAGRQGSASHAHQCRSHTPASYVFAFFHLRARAHMPPSASHYSQPRHHRVRTDIGRLNAHALDDSRTPDTRPATSPHAFSFSYSASICRTKSVTSCPLCAGKLSANAGTQQADKLYLTPLPLRVVAHADLLAVDNDRAAVPKPDIDLSPHSRCKQRTYTIPSACTTLALSRSSALPSSPGTSSSMRAHALTPAAASQSNPI